MRGTAIYVLALAITSLCAHSSPLPSQSFNLPRSIARPHHDTSLDTNPSRPHHDSSSILLKRTPVPGRPSTPLLRSASDALEKKGKDWKRPVVIAISAIGVLMTVGWNYISLQSFLSNRAKYRARMKQLEAEKGKPPPRIGDVVCTVQTFTTTEQVDERKPGEWKGPCFKLDGGKDGMVGTSPVVASSPMSGVGPVQSSTKVLPAEIRGSDQPQPGWGTQPNFQASMGPMPETSSTISASSSPALNSASFGRFVKRGIPPTSSAGEIVEQVSPRLSPMSVIHGLPPTPSEPSTSLSPVTHAKHIPHIPFSRDQRRPEEVTPLLTEPLRSSAFPFGSARKRPNFPLPNIDTSHANLNQKFSNDEKRLATFDIESKSPIQEEQQSELKPKIQNTTKKMKTEDITFALTILNTIGNIPSLILTMINAYYYRGNPKVD